MTDSSDPSEAPVIASTMQQISAAWLTGRPELMAPLLSESVAMALPGFQGTIQGRETFIAGFREFCETAVLNDCHLEQPDVTVAGSVGIVTFRFVVVYTRGGARWRSAGRELWVFERATDSWRAAWRTMLDLEEEPAR